MGAIEKAKEEIENYNTTDADLVELAGYHAYKNYNVGEIEDGVNGKNFYVVDLKKTMNPDSKHLLF